jgi:hypothetical protein
MRAIRRLLILVAICGLVPVGASGQGLTGSLAGTVRDEQGGVLSGAVVRLSSPALIRGELPTTTNDKGEFRFPVLPPGDYKLTVESPKFKPAVVERIRVGAGDVLNWPVVLTLTGVTQTVTVSGLSASSLTPGMTKTFGRDYFATIPSTRNYQDTIRSTPGVSPTSPSSVTAMTVSVWGSAVNGNLYLIDGTNFTCPCQGVSRAEPGMDVIQEVQIQSLGATVEHGGSQGAVFNVITRQGGARFQGDVSYYAQPSWLTAQPVRLVGVGGVETGYERIQYRDTTANLGGPVVPERLWFFAGYHYLHDYDSQPGADPATPRKYEQDKFFAKLTWQLTPNLHLMHTFNAEAWLNPTVPTVTTPYIATLRQHATVPSTTFGHLTHVLSDKTVWDVRVGWFRYDQDNYPNSGDIGTSSRRILSSGAITGNAPNFGGVVLDRITAKAVLQRFESGWPGGRHHLRAGVEIERGEHHFTQAFTGGVQFVDSAPGVPSQSLSRDAWLGGGRFITSALFFSDSVSVGDRLTADAGLRFDHIDAISQDLGGVSADAQEIDGFTPGLGTLYRWNVLSPRLGAILELDAEGRTRLRASYGRFYQGVLTGELDIIHPGVTAITRRTYDPVSGLYVNPVILDPKTTQAIDSSTRAPRTDEYSVGIDRQIGTLVIASAAYVRKRSRDFIGWTDVRGVYQQETRTLDNGTVVPVWQLLSGIPSRYFVLSNQDELGIDYDGLVLSVEKRMSDRWQGSASYMFSRTSGMLVTSNQPVAEPQFSTIARPNALTFGQDPNDLTNADGRLANDRPHVFRAMAVVQLPWQDVLVGANLQTFSGRPWAAVGMVRLSQTGNQPTQRVLLEPKGTRRLSPASLLDLRVARTFRIARVLTADLRFDVLNLLNDSAEEALQTDVQSTQGGTGPALNPAFGLPGVFMDPRRVMLSVRLNFGG